MNNLDSAGLVAQILSFIGEKRDWPTEKLQKIRPEEDLLVSTVLDSLGFVELVSHLEDKTGIFIDFTELDPSQVMSIRGLVDHILAESRS